MDVSVSYYTSVGGRSNNEDAMILAEGGNGLLAIVADGLGGENSGEIASQIAVHQLSNNVLIAEVNENVMKQLWKMRIKISEENSWKWIQK